MGIADRRQREKEQRKTGIIDAAECLFFSRSYENVSMEDIARKVRSDPRTGEYWASVKARLVSTPEFKTKWDNENRDIIREQKEAEAKKAQQKPVEALEATA